MNNEQWWNVLTLLTVIISEKLAATSNELKSHLMTVEEESKKLVAEKQKTEQQYVCVFVCVSVCVYVVKIILDRRFNNTLKPLPRQLAVTFLLVLYRVHFA